MLKVSDKISIIIVNWNAGDQLDRCLSSITKFSCGNVTKVVVVDNASHDGSDKNLEHFDLPLEIIHNDKNLGFAAACNQGAALSKEPYLLFLNPDTELFENSLKVPLAFMEDEKNQKVGICGIQLINKQGDVARTCSHFPSLSRLAIQSSGINKLPGLKGFGVKMNNWDHNLTQKVDQVMGAFFFIRRTVFEELDGFDERFFVYFEEVDFSYRAMQLGWETFYLSEAKAFHADGGTSEQVKATRLFYSLRSRMLYGFKHFPLWKGWLLIAITLLFEPFSRSFFSLLRGSVNDMLNTWEGYQMLYRDFPNILKMAKEGENK